MRILNKEVHRYNSNLYHVFYFFAIYFEFYFIIFELLNIE